MAAGLSLDPSVQFGGAGAIAPTRKQTLESAFPGLRVLGDNPADHTPAERQAEKQAAKSEPQSPLASGDTLLTAQQQDQTDADSKPKSPDQLSDADKEQVAKLKQRDAQVRAHERAHAAVGGQYAGAPSYSYQRGPDGQLYAVGGEVSIDIGAESDPQATLQKAAQVAAAALAPADPSGADRAVAAAAQQLRLQALAQIREEKRAEDEQKQAERAEDRAAAAAAQPGQQTEATQPGAPQGKTARSEATEPGVANAATNGPARQASEAYRRQSEAAGPVANDNAGSAAALAGAHRRIGRLVGLIA